MTSAQPRVAVVIPCYRQAAFLPEAVASVLEQRGADWELIIVDDGSPDDTAAVAEALIAANPGLPIHLLRQANSGLGPARNAGFRASRAPYLLPLDADDALAPDMLRRALAALEARPAAGFAYTDADWFGVESRRYRPGPFDAARLAVNNYLLPHALIRRVSWEGAGGYCGRGVVPGFEDWDLWLSIVEAGWQGHYLPEPLVRYRRRDESMLAAARRDDLLLRARLVLRHQRLYARPFVAWAARYAGAPHPERWGVWLRAFGAYAALIARHHPRQLPKTVGRPLWARLSARRQGQLRRLLTR